MKTTRLYFDHHFLRGNVLLIVAYKYEHPFPVAMVHGLMQTITSKKVFTTLDSYIPEWQRRHGVRTAVNTYLFNDWSVDAIITPSGTSEGKLFLDASGYVIDRRTGFYVLTKNKHRKIQKDKEKNLEK